MRLARKRRDAIIAMNMTPMIDIVFLLIIFFMTVNQVTEISKERLALPLLKGGEDQVASSLVVNVDKDGSVVVSGLRYTVVQLVTMIDEQIRMLGDDPARLKVVVRADRSGASRTVNEVVSALGRLGVSRVRIAIESGEG